MPPVTQSSAELQKVFEDVRAQFTLAYSKCNRSGQNNPSNFERYCLTMRCGNGLSDMGKRC